MTAKPRVLLLVASILLLVAAARADDIPNADQLICAAAKASEYYSDGTCQQGEQQAAQAQQATQTQVENFRNAVSVCLEAKDYMVKS